MDAHVSLIHRLYAEGWGKGNLDVFDEVFHDDYLRHDARPGDAPGPEGQKRVASSFREAIPDLAFQLEALFGDGDYVCASWTATGTHEGQWHGLKPTGRTIRFSGANIFRFADGKVAELWNHRDDLGLMEQMDAPTPPSAPAPPQ
jgi:predicted ester cyclase